MTTSTNSGRSKWKSPSNIALVKYWGKKGFQIPSNASLSFTLSNCHTITELEWEASTELSVEVFFEGRKNEAFAPKVLSFFEHVSNEHPVLKNYRYKLHTENTFPHSSGIASSASGMSALALCVCSMLVELGGTIPDFFQEASHLARIGSGSASRSVYGGLVEWGIHDDYDGSSDHYAVPYKKAHNVFNNFQDTILIVHEGQKSVSSSIGHGLLNDHPLAERRFDIAQQNMEKLKEILDSGDLDKFVELVEFEALMLHSLMMTSSPSYILMEPNTLAIIQKIRDFRKQNGTHITFTLDAGANVHLLYPEKDIDMAKQLLDNELVGHCVNGKYICDNVGNGPTQLEC
ncbi:MAG: diphosphomevalonate decarboxylase [Bacteroidia bacterium]|nr:diphosphomevalonate decarboxylase [Bacteroidia bacterium]